MNWLQFIAALVAALAWPTAAIFVVVLFRRPLLELLPMLRKLKVKDLEAEFERVVTKTGAAVVALANELEKGPEPKLLHPRSYYMGIAEVSPRAAIMEAWVELEAAASETFRKKSSQGMRALVSPREILEFLRYKDLISEDDFKRAEGLRQLRNKVAHDAELTELRPELVAGYIDSTLGIAARLRQVEEGDRK